MTSIRLSVSQIPGTELYLIEPMPEAFVVRPSGLAVHGYPKEFAHRMVASFNALADLEVEQIEAGILEYAVEKIRLLETLATGCPKHKNYRAKRQPHPTCRTCVGIWEAAQELREMSARSQPDKVRRIAVAIEAGLLAPAMESARGRVHQAVQQAIQDAFRHITFPLIERKERPIDRGRLR